MFNLDDYDYDLPRALIAQQPEKQRDRSRLLVMERQTGALSHHVFADLLELLNPSDTLVINNTEVIPGRLLGRKKTGGKAEVLIINYAGRKRLEDERDALVCECLIKSAKKTRPGATIEFRRGLTAEVLAANNNIFTVKFKFSGDFGNILNLIGKVPLPPYIKRDRHDTAAADDRQTYQTVYASQKGAIAAPTAGFHFTDSFLNKIKAKGVQIVEITLHIGYGTFLPVRVTDIRRHNMHAEWYSVSEAAADRINGARRNKNRIIAVGTTCVRTLEFLADENGNVVSGSGQCDLFIFPGYDFRVVDAMLTNFHLPKSTLMMLVSAFADRIRILKAYQEAINHKYRFYSYGDAMFIA